MGRLKTSEKQIPTLHLRNKAWTRDISRQLFPKQNGMRPLSHLINGALIDENNKISKGYVRQANAAILSTPKGDFISAGRWHGWWAGKTHPSDKKIEMINRILPSTADWFSPELEKNLQHRVRRLLYSVDLWKRALGGFQPVHAILLLQKIGGKWNPVPARTIKDDSSISVEGWMLPAVPEIKAIKLLEFNFEKHYRILEPSSVTHIMLLCVKYYQEVHMKLDWVFDLVASALATMALLCKYNRDSAAFLTFGPSGDVAACVYDLFVNDREKILGKGEDTGIVLIRSRIRTCGDNLLNDTLELAVYLYQTIEIYEQELKCYGIIREEILGIDVDSHETT